MKKEKEIKLYATKDKDDSFDTMDEIQTNLQDALDYADHNDEVYELTPKLIGHVIEPQDQNALKPLIQK